MGGQLATAVGPFDALAEARGRRRSARRRPAVEEGPQPPAGDRLGKILLVFGCIGIDL